MMHLLCGLEYNVCISNKDKTISTHMCVKKKELNSSGFFQFKFTYTSYIYIHIYISMFNQSCDSVAIFLLLYNYVLWI